MLEVLCKFICFSIMLFTGTYSVKKLVSGNLQYTIKSLIYIIALTLISMCLHPDEYTIIYSLTIFVVNIAVFKQLFNINLNQSTIAYSIFMMILVLSDLIVNTVFNIFYTTDQIRNDFLISIMANLSISILSVCILNTKSLFKIFKKFYDNLENNKVLTDIVYMIMLIIGICHLGYNYAIRTVADKDYFSNLIIIIVFMTITIMFLKNKNSYKHLVDEYDNLFTYVQNFEDWIEKEQLNRHEYKNQLAVLRCLTTEKKVKDKIDDILEDNINIEDAVVHKLKELPKGGLKGLMYYKAAIAEKNKIKLEVDVSLTKKSLLNKLSEPQMKVLCKLVGIYFDNAIEAAVETRKKIVSLEIYELKEQVNIVISNTFKKSANFSKRNERGVTTKGEGHGNGLYFANNLISKNKWLASKQEVIDGYYIETLTIKKPD